VARSWRVIAAVAMLVGCLLVPARAQATLVFTRNPFSPTVFAANDDGSAARKIGGGSTPRVSPDGQTVVFIRYGGKPSRQLMVAPTLGGPVRKLAAKWQDPYTFAWSPDSSMVVTVLGPELGRQRLVAIDVASGVQQTVANGFFNGVSFAPTGGQLVYGRSNSEFGPKSDVYRFDIPEPGAIFVKAPQPVILTADHRSFSPLWGPNEKIVFVKHLGGKKRKFGPKNELFLMKPNGGQVKRLTHTKVEPLLSGLSPIAWSASGEQLLAEFGGQDTTYAVTVNPETGAERALTSEREVGFVGTAISKDGKFVLGSLGGFEPGPGHEVVRIPYKGGKPKVLAENASEPDWSR
jgi:Tol biopolymer transport system component